MGLISVIDCKMGHDQLAVRSFIEDFNSKSQLIVDESQSAIFYKDGQALDEFGAGRHPLDTNNLPLMTKLINKLLGVQKVFSCHVYFINRKSILDAFWGTTAPVLVQDPEMRLPCYLRANGQMGVHVREDGVRNFVVKIVGQLEECNMDFIKRSIRSTVNSIVKEVIAQAIVDGGVSVLEINTKLGQLAERMRQKINLKLEDYGLEVENFNVDTLEVDENDLERIRQRKERRRDAYDEADLESYKIGKLSEARAKARATEGYTYYDERRFNVLDSAAQNESSAGGFINMGVGLGVGAGVGREIGGMFNGATQQMQQTQQPQQPQQPMANQGGQVAHCPSCGAQVMPGAKFCSGCGQKIEIPQNTFCTQCGTQVMAGAKFCPNCGNKIC